MGNARRSRVFPRSIFAVKLFVLGSAHSISNENHRHTHLAIIGNSVGLLVDCGVCPRSRMETLGIGRDAITDVILTHFHPDHVAGFPLYLMELWRTGRTRPLRVHAPRACLERVESMCALYESENWPGMFPIRFSRIEDMPCANVVSNSEFSVVASHVRHYSLPTIAVRVEVVGGESVVYSSDTEPIDAMVHLARDADILFHEATGEGAGHSSARQAGAIGQRAGVKKLMLIHYDPLEETDLLIRAAQTSFQGEVGVAADCMQFNLS
jgi:ribonuclease Z